MILQVTFSKPASALVVQNALCAVYKKIKIRLDTASSENTRYFCEMFTEKQVFHKKLSEAELTGFIEDHAGKTFKNCIVRTEDKEITYLGNKKGKITKLERKLPGLTTGEIPNQVRNNKTSSHAEFVKSGHAEFGKASHAELVSASLNNRKKNYLLPEGQPVPFLVLTGIMTPEGKVIASRYDKFRQINRFLEFINDVLPEVMNRKTEGEPLRIADFGCGKSYLTFAVHYYLTQVCKIHCEIEGLDLKKDVIEYCNKIVSDLKLQGIGFSTGDISDYSGEKTPDIVITLHACDTATDYALEYAVSKNATAILSVPCCQHEVNTQLQSGDHKVTDETFEPLLKWGIIREKFSSLVTDVLRAQYLENKGYKVQVLEFIDMEHTPKNILIRAVKQLHVDEGRAKKASCAAHGLSDALGINPEIMKNF